MAFGLSTRRIAGDAEPMFYEKLAGVKKQTPVTGETLKPADLAPER